MWDKYDSLWSALIALGAAIPWFVMTIGGGDCMLCRLLGAVLLLASSYFFYQYFKLR